MDGNELSAQLKSAQTLLTISIIGAMVSLIIGGVILTLVTFILALVARSKIKSVIELDDDHQLDRSSTALMRQTNYAIAINLVAAVLNIISLVIVMSTVIEYMRNGDLEGLFQALGFSDVSNMDLPEKIGNSDISIWDK